MKTEKEKMLSNELYNHKDAELTKERNHAVSYTHLNHRSRAVYYGDWWQRVHRKERGRSSTSGGM